MKVFEITSFGAPDVLRPAERPLPVAGVGELLIAVSASGINRPDVLQRTGNYPVPPGASDIPGLEVAGVIVSGDAAAIERITLRDDISQFHGFPGKLQEYVVGQPLDHGVIASQHGIHFP